MILRLFLLVLLSLLIMPIWNATNIFHDFVNFLMIMYQLINICFKIMKYSVKHDMNQTMSHTIVCFLAQNHMYDVFIRI